jgi:hypothetical protein
MRKTVAQIFEEIGLDREGVIAAVAGVARPPPPERTKPRDKPRPICKVCKKPINALNCAPIRYK